RVRFRPVVVGKLFLPVFWGRRELEYVGLRQADVLCHLPERIREAGRNCRALVTRHVRHRLLEVRVRVPGGEKFLQQRAELGIGRIISGIRHESSPKSVVLSSLRRDPHNTISNLLPARTTESSDAWMSGNAWWRACSSTHRSNRRDRT